MSPYTRVRSSRGNRSNTIGSPARNGPEPCSCGSAPCGPPAAIGVTGSRPRSTQCSCTIERSRSDVSADPSSISPRSPATSHRRSVVRTSSIAISVSRCTACSSSMSPAAFTRRRLAIVSSSSRRTAMPLARRWSASSRGNQYGTRTVSTPARRTVFSTRASRSSRSRPPAARSSATTSSSAHTSVAGLERLASSTSKPVTTRIRWSPASSHSTGSEVRKRVAAYMSPFATVSATRSRPSGMTRTIARGAAQRAAPLRWSYMPLGSLIRSSSPSSACVPLFVTSSEFEWRSNSMPPGSVSVPAGSASFVEVPSFASR